MNDLQRAKKNYVSLKRNRKFKVTPKKNRSAYIFFTQECKNCNPGVHLNCLMKEIAAKWAKMTDKEKEPYIRMAQKDKKRYMNEKKQFLECHKQENLGILPPLTKKKKKRNKMTPYLLFAKDARKVIINENSCENPAQIMKKIAEQWRVLSDEKRKPYYDLCEKLKKEDKEYEKKELESFFENFRHKKRKNSHSELQMVKKMSPFLLFCREQRTNQLEPISVTNLADKWNSLDYDQKEKYYEMYRKEKSIKEKELSQIKQSTFPEAKQMNKNEFLEKNSDFGQTKHGGLDNFILDFNKFLMVRKNLLSHGFQSSLNN